MATLLVVDDTPFWRDVVGDTLRMHAHTVLTASNGVEALATLKLRNVDLIILDVEMPEMQGLSVLEQIRGNPRWATLPVIMLTGDTQKDHILLAKKLSAGDYLLKARFSPHDLLERVNRRLTTPAAVTTARSTPEATGRGTGEVIPPKPAKLPQGLPASLDSFSPLLSREKCLARVSDAMSGRTLSGIVAEVMASAASPRVELLDLTTLVGRDAVLAARVLQAANSASNASARGIITALIEAVRVVGCSGVRNIAASTGVYETMPPPEKDGFDPLRSWQHALAVAQICDLIAPVESRPLAYLVGLCHDLGEILFRTHFAAEYRKVLEIHEATGLPLHRLEMQLIGATHGEISKEIVKLWALPESICRPVNLYHQALRTGVKSNDPLARVLHAADLYAGGLLLAPSVFQDIAPLSKINCREYPGSSAMNPSKAEEMRGEIVALTAVHARLPAKELKLLTAPLLARSETRLLVLRDITLSEFDPVLAALSRMATITYFSDLPAGIACGDYDAIVVIHPGAQSTIALPEGSQELCATATIPVLVLPEGKSAATSGEGSADCDWPLTLDRLKRMIESMPVLAVA